MARQYRILYLDDVKLDRELVRDALKDIEPPLEIVETRSKEEFQARLLEGEFDLVLSDLHVPGLDIGQVIDLVHSQNPRIPVVFVTGTGSEELAVEVVKRGAADYVIKQLQHLRRLPAAILSAIDRRREYEERDRAEARVDAQHRVTAALANFETLAEASPVILEAVCMCLDWDFGAMWHADARTGILSCAETWSRPNRNLCELERTTREMAVTGGVSLPGRVNESQAATWIADFVSDGSLQRAAAAAKSGLHGAFAVPVRTGTKVLAVLEFFSTGVRPQAPPELAMMDAISSQIGQFIERRRAEAGLRASEERLRLALTAARMGTWDVDLATGAAVVSDEGARLLGKSPANGEELYALVHVDDVQNVRDGVARSLTDGAHQGRFAQECRIVFPDGGIRWLRSHGMVVRDSAGQPVRLLGAFTDITEERSLEEQLRHSQKMEAVGSLAGGVAHDFNNLLTAILGFSDLLLDDIPSHERAHGMVGEIRRCGERAVDLTRQLLAFSRRQILTPTVLDLNAVVREMERMLRRLIGEDVELMTILDPLLGAVKADPSQLEHVLVNLAVNARDAMPQGGRLTLLTANAELDAVFCATHAGVQPGSYVRLSVIDTGSGIPPEMQARIFEPFFTTKPSGKGTGLGLATVFGTVCQSGGHIFVDSEVGRGATFELYLPRVSQAQAVTPQTTMPQTTRPQTTMPQTTMPQTTRPQTTRPQTTISHPPRGTETLLLVEDEPGVRDITRVILEALGYNVLVAASGAEAVTKSDGYDGVIHLLFTDVVMPHMSGRQLAQTLTSRRPDMRVLFMSGYTDDHVVRHGISENVVSFLAKPFTRLSLAQKIREILDS